MFTIFILAIAFLAITVLVYINQPQFGRKPGIRRREKIIQSPNYKAGKFHNLNPTPQFSEGATFFTVFYDFFFKRAANRIPTKPIPMEKTDLQLLPKDADVLIWFGHSSYFFQVDGKTFLVDPVFSGNASPVPGSNKSFAGANYYQPENMPQIDFLIITHDHYDHLDYKTVKALLPKVAQVYCGLGVGEHLERWGYQSKQIHELDWYDSIEIELGFQLTATPARHFSGRSFNTNNTLWLSFVLKTPNSNLFIGGDSGYDTHFKEIGTQFGPFDLAMLENGQYNSKWKYIHAYPEEVVKAAVDLQARKYIPVHSGKFAMANHTWYEPLKLVTEFNTDSTIITPKIGAPVYFKQDEVPTEKWWEALN